MTNSDGLQPDSGHVIFFQWSPDPGYRGEVNFVSLVMRGANVFWEEATGIRVVVMDQHGTDTDQTEEDKENTTKWSTTVTHSTNYTEEDESYIYNGTSFSPEYFEPYERLEAEHGGWSKPKNLATEMEAHRTLIVLVFLFILLS